MVGTYVYKIQSEIEERFKRKELIYHIFLEDINDSNEWMNVSAKQFSAKQFNAKQFRCGR